MADTDSDSGLADAAADDITDDDWAAAMQEQVVADAAVPEIALAQPASFQNFDSSSGPSPTSMNDFDLILDIPVQLTVELGRTKISIRNLLQLAHGSVVELDALAGEPMDVLINGTLIAQGEVVVVNDKFGIRLTDIITPSERVRKLRN